MKIKFSYVEGENYFSSYANGVWGGLTPAGLIDCNFYLERTGYPDSEEIEINERNKIIDKKILFDDSNVIREVHCSILMDINFARSLVQWLHEHIDTFETREASGKLADEPTTE